MVRRRGTTLVELLVVMSVWCFIMVAVLGFYIYGTKITKREDQVSGEIRAVQQVADKFNTFLRNADLLEVDQFPPAVIFHRSEEAAPCLPGCLLPNWSVQTEFIGIAPDPKRAGPNADPKTCKQNAIYLGIFGQAGEPIMQLPDGLIAEMRVTKGILILSFNNPQPSNPQAIPTPQGRDQYKKLESIDWHPMNHYFSYRGMTSRTLYRGL